ncbi:MAG: hypothetical protein K2N35_09975 [Muribaculaceae bacterium]|nr:hypothetical protein [Muribaculaceae bacterium]
MKEKTKTKMWSYKIVHDTLFAPNPLWGVLTLATCKPTIRRSPNSIKGTWIAGWTACTTHNLEVYGGGIDRCDPGQEKLIYLAKIDEQIPLDEYWKRFPEKRNNPNVTVFDARWSGDNIYHKDNTDAEGNVIAEPNTCDHEGAEVAKRDYLYGKNALICNEFYYFTRENRLDVPEYFRSLVHKAKGQSLLKNEPLIDEFIEFVRESANKLGVENGIVGKIPVNYPDISVSTDTLSGKLSDNPQVKVKKKGCAK